MQQQRPEEKEGPCPALFPDHDIPPLSTERKIAVACERCGFYGMLQLFHDIPPELFALSLSRKRPVAKGEILFQEGAPFHGIYAVQEGCFKGYALTSDGAEQISGFYLPGELLGLESIQTESYMSSAVALETGYVCWLPLDHLNRLEDRFPLFQEQMIRILTDRLLQQRQQFLLSARQTAEERLAAFLLNLAERYIQRGLEGHFFRLPMLRQDIANFLGLSMETVSRTMHKLQAKKLLQVIGKQIHLLDVSGLQAIARYASLGGVLR